MIALWSKGSLTGSLKNRGRWMPELNGLVLIDKDAGMTSHDVVDRLRRHLKMEAVGHAGTLDPLATGLLVCLVGEGTKLSQYVMSEEKEYRVGCRLGLITDSGDVTGVELRRAPHTPISWQEVEREVAKLVGPLTLEVPRYSAVKVK